MYPFTNNSAMNPAAMMTFASANRAVANHIAQYRNTSIDNGDNVMNGNKVSRHSLATAGAGGSLVIRPNDVLCGRGKVSFNHCGNRRFRHIVSQAIDEYSAASSKWEKSLVAARLVSVIHSAGGRFLKQKKDNEDEWYELSSSESKSKVSHAIRDAIAATKQTRRPSQEIRSNGALNNIDDVEERPTVAITSGLSTKGMLQDTSTERQCQGLTRMMKPQYRGTWSSNSLVSLTDDSEEKVIRAKPDSVASKMNESFSSSSEEDDSTDSTDGDFPDDFVEYIHGILGPTHP